MWRRALLRVLVQVSRFGLAALFLFAAAAKIATFQDFAANLTNLVDARYAWPLAIAVISAEALTTILLLWPRSVRMGGLLSAALLLGFAAYALFYVYVQHGEPLECGCFGRLIASQLGVTTALRNLALLIPSALVIFGLPRLRRTETVETKPPAPSTTAPS
jgi:hypothetical protein